MLVEFRGKNEILKVGNLQRSVKTLQLPVPPQLFSLRRRCVKLMKGGYALQNISLFKKGYLEIL